MAWGKELEGSRNTESLPTFRDGIFMVQSTGVTDVLPALGSTHNEITSATEAWSSTDYFPTVAEAVEIICVKKMTPTKSSVTVRVRQKLKA